MLFDCHRSRLRIKVHSNPAHARGLRFVFSFYLKKKSKKMENSGVKLTMYQNNKRERRSKERVRNEGKKTPTFV